MTYPYYPRSGDGVPLDADPAPKPITRDELTVELDEDPASHAESFEGSVRFAIRGLTVMREEFQTVALFVFNTLSEDRIAERLAAPTWPSIKKKPAKK